MGRVLFEWRVGDLPFCWKPLHTPGNEGLPEVLPFVAGVDPLSGRLIQKSSRQVLEALEVVYRRGSQISGLMDDWGIGYKYAEDYLRFLDRSLTAAFFDGIKVLEIGCGTGYLLSRLKTWGSDVTGIEPGPQGEEGGKRFDVRVIRDFFPSSHVRDRFDVIVFHSVLEHMENPAGFLETVGTFLTPRGHVALSVPDCEPYIKTGDISCFLHEHWSYFTGRTLRNTLAQAGYEDIRFEPSHYGGLLYATAAIAERREPGRQAQGPDEMVEFVEQAWTYTKKSERVRERMVGLLGSAAGQGKTVGIYVPGRIVNALAAYGIADGRIRFFDDNPALEGTYYPGINVRVESKAGLIAHAPDGVLIMSRSFAEKIAQELRKILPASTPITTWEYLFQTGG